MSNRVIVSMIVGDDDETLYEVTVDGQSIGAWADEDEACTAAEDASDTGEYLTGGECVPS